MIDREIWMLAGTAATLGLVHTVIGPDHYLPFIVIGRARGWALRKTLFVSFLAGLGHILSSVVLGFAGIALGIAVSKLEGVESARGELAAWLLIGFGFAYFLWGMRRAWRGKAHTHAHIHGHLHENGSARGDDHGPDGGRAHDDGHVHEHPHTHVLAEHAHLHGEGKKANITPWVLFTIFVFGPCEPLIPLLMYPAARHSAGGVALVAAAFGVTTIGTMLAIIALSSWGARFVKLGRLERYAHALAGLMIFVSGLTVQFLGL
jgi:ABC-type nickel/cobalt efflux system permease component RcnA